MLRVLDTGTESPAGRRQAVKAEEAARGGELFSRGLKLSTLARTQRMLCGCGLLHINCMLR